MGCRVQVIARGILQVIMQELFGLICCARFVRPNLLHLFFVSGLSDSVCDARFVTAGLRHPVYYSRFVRPCLLQPVYGTLPMPSCLLYPVEKTLENDPETGHF